VWPQFGKAESGESREAQQTMEPTHATVIASDGNVYGGRLISTYDGGLSARIGVKWDDGGFSTIEGKLQTWRPLPVVDPTKWGQLPEVDPVSWGTE